MYQKLQESWKALTGGIIALATMIVGFNADENIDLDEWGKVIAAVAAFVVAFAGVWIVRNKKPLPPPPPPPPPPPIPSP